MKTVSLTRIPLRFVTAECSPTIVEAPPPRLDGGKWLAKRTIVGIADSAETIEHQGGVFDSESEALAAQREWPLPSE